MPATLFFWLLFIDLIMRYFWETALLCWLRGGAQEKYCVGFRADLSKQNMCRTGLVKLGYSLVETHSEWFRTWGALRMGWKPLLGPDDPNVASDGYLLKSREKRAGAPMASTALSTSRITSAVVLRDKLQGRRPRPVGVRGRHSSSWTHTHRQRTGWGALSRLVSHHVY